MKHRDAWINKRLKKGTWRTAGRSYCSIQLVTQRLRKPQLWRPKQCLYLVKHCTNWAQEDFPCFSPSTLCYSGMFMLAASCSNILEKLLFIWMPSLAEEQGICCSLLNRGCSCYCLKKCLRYKTRTPAEWVCLVTSCPWELSVRTISANNSADTYWGKEWSTKLLCW